MSKYSKELKQAVIKQYISGKGGYRALGAQYGINHSHIRKWINAFKVHGKKSLSRGRTHYSSAFKLSVLKAMEQDQISLIQAAARFNIPAPSSITVWQRLYNEGGITALEPKPKGRPPMSKKTDYTALLSKPVSELSHEDLLKRLEYLEVENAYLKKLEALAQQKILAKQNKSKSSRS
jgi:transposase